MYSSTTGVMPSVDGVMPLHLVLVNGIFCWRDARSGRTFPQIAGAEDPPGDGGDSDGDNADDPANANGDDAADADSETLRQKLKAQRAGEKRLKDLLKTQAQELEALKVRQRERDDAEKSDSEKLAAKVTELTASLTETQSTLKAIRVDNAIAEAARKNNARNPAVIARLLDQSKLELDDTGTPINADDLVKELLKAEPYLVADKSNGTSGVPPTPRGDGQAPTEEERKKKAVGIRTYW